MTPKEKAEELVDKFYPRATSYSSDRRNQIENAIQCALIAVDEISWILNELDHHNDVESEMYFYNEVKQEIKNL